MRNGRPMNANPGKNLVSFLMVLLVLTIGIGIGTLISYRVGAVGPGDSQLKIQTDGKPIVGGAALLLSQAFEEVAKRVEPAVVNINTEEVVKLSGQRRSQNRRGQQQQPPQQPQQNPRQRERDPMDDLLNRLPFFGTPELPDQYTRKSLGSGVIVDPKGYIITNNHVVEGASKIKVSVEEQEYTAHVIAADQLSDIAVIKIEGTKEFAYARIGDAKGMKVGDWVLAIGSPFGLEQTVTAGIVSATGRVFPDAAQTGSMAMMFNDYLQTDAAINPGNSGGPLVNLNGEVVGINTFISTTTRSSAGVGFAVPSHIFVNVYNQILEKGKVTRGWLGVNMNYGMPWTPAMAKFFGVKQGRGVLITGLSEESGKPSENGPAARAGMKAEDVVVEFDGKKISTVQDLRLAVASTPPGRKVRVKVVRHGVEKDLEVAVGERKLEDQDARAGRGGFSFEEREEEPKPEIGLEFDDLPPQMVSELKIPGGALINSVRAGSLAEEASLEEGNIVVAANGKPILAARDLFNIIRDLKKGDAAVLKFLRVQRDERGGVNGATFFTSIQKP